MAASGLIALVGSPALAADDAADDADFFDLYGWSVAADGEHLVVGAPGDNEGGLNAGAVYIYERDDDAWRLKDKLLSDPPRPFRYFGASVALAGDLLVVGAPNDYNRRPDAQGPGEAHVYRRSGRRYALDAVLVAEPATIRDNFGGAVATDGARVIVGASRLYYGDEVRSRAFVFADAGGWGLVGAPLESSLPWACLPSFSTPCADPAYYFGASVAIDGDWAMVGDPMREDTTVFRRDADTWSEHSHVAEASVLSVAGDVAALSGRLYGLAADEGAWEPLAPGFAGTEPTIAALRGDLAVVSTVVTEEPEVVLHYDLHRRDGAAWPTEASLMDEERGRNTRYNVRSTAVSDAVVAFGRAQADVVPEVEGVGDYAGRVELFSLDGAPLEPLTADTEGCACAAAPAPRGGAAAWLGLVALGLLLRGRGRGRPIPSRARRRRVSKRTGFFAAAVAAALTAAAPSPVDACSVIYPPYITVGEGSPKLKDIPTDGAFVVLLAGDSAILEDLESALDVSVSLDGAPVAGEVSLKVLFDGPFGQRGYTAVLVVWRPEGGALAPSSTYALRLSYPLDSGSVPYWDYEATTAAGPMGPLTPPEATAAQLRPIEVGGEAEVCCESPDTDSCADYYWCRYTVRHYLPGLDIRAATTMPPGDAAVTRAFVAVEGAGGELEEVAAISPQTLLYENTIKDVTGVSGELVFDEGQASYCVTLGAENLATGEVVYGDPICLEHGDLAAPATVDVGIDGSFLLWCGEGAVLYDAESGLPLEGGEASGGCRVVGDTRGAGELGLLVAGLGLGLVGARRRRRRRR